MYLIDVTRLYFVNYPTYRQMFQKKPPQILTTSDVRLLHVNCLCTIGHGTGTGCLLQAGVMRLTSSNRFQNSFGSFGEVTGEYSHDHVQKGAQQYVQAAATSERQTVN